MRIPSPHRLRAAALGAVALLAAPEITADTVRLRNGSTVSGRAVDQRADSGRVIVEFAAGGRLEIKATDVVGIEANDRDDTTTLAAQPQPASAPAKKRVDVRLKDGSEYYGSGTIHGWLSSKPEDADLVLELPGGGKLTLPKSAAEVVEVTEDAAAARPAVEEGAKAVKTSHVVHLKNGRKLIGTVLPGPESEPLKVAVGGLGVLTLSRQKIDKVDAAEGSYALPEPPVAVEPAENPRLLLPAEVIEELKKEIRRQVVRELLEGLVDDKVEAKIQAAVDEERSFVEVDVSRLEPAAILDIQFHVRELCRQRSTNRVRAESSLKRFGPAALAFLEPAVRHPLDLTRRAAQRVVGAIGDLRGTPLAIAALDDDDVVVRESAHESVRRLLGEDLGYDPQAARPGRRAAQDRLWSLWLEVQKDVYRRGVSSRNVGSNAAARG